MKTSSIHQTVIFNALPLAVYELLMDEKQHAAFTEAPARIGKQVNDTFEVFEGYCQGKNLELIPGVKIVQEWNFAEDGWPDDHYSICTFELRPVDVGTELKFTQTGVPIHKLEALEFGWKEYYWDRMQDYLTKEPS